MYMLGVSGDFCIRSPELKISVYAVYLDTCGRPYPYIFCIRWRPQHRNQSFSPRKLSWLILWDARVRIGYVWTVVYASCGRGYFCIRIKKISGYVWTGPKSHQHICQSRVYPFNVWSHGVTTWKRPIFIYQKPPLDMPIGFLADDVLNVCYDVRDNSAFTTRLEVNKAWRITTFFKRVFEKWGNLSFWTATHTGTISLKLPLPWL